MKLLTAVTITLVAVAMLCAVAPRASANIVDIIPELQAGSPVPVGSDWRWVYRARVHEFQRVEAGDYFTIYDFAGFTGAHSEPAGWVFASALLGTTPNDVLPTDNPNLPNLTWQWTGAPIAPGSDLGLFTADTPYNTPMLRNFTGYATKNAPGLPADGTKVSNIGQVAVPVAVPGIPEPGTVLLSGLGLLGGALVRQRFRKRS